MNLTCGHCWWAAERRANTASGRSGRRRRGPSNRPAVAGQAEGVPRKRRRHQITTEQAAGYSRQAPLPNSMAATARMAPFPSEPRSLASDSFGEDLYSSNSGEYSADSADYSPRAHQELLHTRLEVREISGASPESQREDALLASPAAAALPLDRPPSGRQGRVPTAARQHGAVRDKSPRHAPPRKSREPPSTPGPPIPEGLEPFGWESRE